MEKIELLKEVFNYYQRKYEICPGGIVKEFNDNGGHILYGSVDTALKVWSNTMDETNKNLFETGDVEDRYNTWSKEDIHLAKF